MREGKHRRLRERYMCTAAFLKSSDKQKKDGEKRTVQMFVESPITFRHAQLTNGKHQMAASRGFRLGFRGPFMFDTCEISGL